MVGGFTCQLNMEDGSPLGRMTKQDRYSGDLNLTPDYMTWEYHPQGTSRGVVQQQQAAQEAALLFRLATATSGGASPHR